MFYLKKQSLFCSTLSRHTNFRGSAVPCESESNHNVVKLNPNEDKYYLLTPYPKLMPSLKKFSPESIRAITRNPNINLLSIVSNPDPIYNITLGQSSSKNSSQKLT